MLTKKIGISREFQIKINLPYLIFRGLGFGVTPRYTSN